MTAFIFGLAIFFGAHFYSAFRSRMPGTDIKTRIGEATYMGLYSMVSIVGLGLIIYGYWSAPVLETIYVVPAWTQMVQVITNAIACVLIVAAYVPANHFKMTLKHPMVIAIVLWSGGHLLTQTDLKEALLFGSFLLFGIVDGIRAYGRPVASEVKARFTYDGVVLFISAVLIAVIYFWAHEALIGVAL